MKKRTSVLIIAMVLIISSAVLIGIMRNGLPEGELLFERTEQAISENMPFAEAVSAFITDIRYKTGVRSFNGTYIGKDGSLLRDIQQPDSRTVAVTKKFISDFGDFFGGDSCFMLIPTASVIRQQELDAYAADRLFNQRRLINETYKELGGSVSLADVYQLLFNKRSEYIYYRTENLPTGLGGFYIYSELAAGLGIRQKDMKDFSAAYAAHGFYGSLAEKQLYKYAQPDFISLYESVSGGEYTVTHYGSDGEIIIQNGIYQPEENHEDKTDIIFGGIYGVTEIESASGSGEKLIVFGDDTVKSWLPFMLNDFSSVTVVELSTASDSQLADIVLSDYSKAVFAYSVESFAEGIDFSKLEKLEH